MAKGGKNIKKIVPKNKVAVKSVKPAVKAVPSQNQRGKIKTKDNSLVR